MFQKIINIKCGNIMKVWQVSFGGPLEAESNCF